MEISVIAQIKLIKSIVTLTFVVMMVGMIFTMRVHYFFISTSKLLNIFGS